MQTQEGVSIHRREGLVFDLMQVGRCVISVMGWVGWVGGMKSASILEGGVCMHVGGGEGEISRQGKVCRDAEQAERAIDSTAQCAWKWAEG